MPEIGEQSGKPSTVVVRPRPAARRPAPRAKPAPAPRPSGAFGGPATATRPFAAQQREQQAQTDRARARLPRTPIAAPPVIRSPSPEQTHAAAKAIATSITRAVGAYGTAQQRLARRDALLREIKSQPRYAQVRRSLTHWATEQAKLITPERAAMNARDHVRPGRAPTRAKLGVGPVNFGTVNLTATSRAVIDAAAKVAPGLAGGTAESQFARNAFKDVGLLATGPFTGGYELGASAVEGIRDRPYLAAAGPVGLVAAIGLSDRGQRLGKGVVKSTAHEITHPAESFREHPILTALDVAGAVSVAGRTAGAVARGAGSTAGAEGVRGSLARAGSTVRPALALTDDVSGGVIARRYSKDSTRKAAQIAEDKAMHKPLLDADGNPVTIRDGGRDVPVLTPATELGRKHLANRRGDILAGRANANERLVRERTAAARTVSTPAGAKVRNALGKLLPSYEGEPVHGIRGRAARDIVAMAVEGTITSAAHLARDLKAHVARLDREYVARKNAKGFRHSEEARTNRRRRALAQKILDTPKALAQAKAIVAEAERHGRALNAADVQKAALGIEEAPRLRRAALETPALEHMGARHFTVEQHRQLERNAAQAEKAAVDAYAGGEDAGRSEGRAGRSQCGSRAPDRGLGP